MSFLAKVNKVLSLEDSNMMQNKDLIPMPVPRRRWSMLSTVWYWAISDLCATVWSQGSSLLSLGLNGNQAMGVAVLGTMFVSVAAVLNGYYASKYHIGYSVFQRVIFGMRGAPFGVLIRCILAIVWFASQSWLGGLCVNVILSSWSRRYLNWENTFPESVPMTNKELVGFVLYMIIGIPFLVMPPETVDWLLGAASLSIFFMGIGITAWAVHYNGGHYGTLMNADITVSSSALGWAWMHALSSWYSSLTAGIANQGDFNRYNRSEKGAAAGIFIGANLTGFIVPLFGIISASALYDKYGEYYWMPQDICMRWLQDDYSATSRAAAFFCGLALVISQFGINCVGNCISGAMDLASLCPRYINIKRGVIIIMLLAWPTQPWLFYNSDSVFITVMSSFSVFVTPLIGVFICDFFVIRKCTLKISDCYNYSKDSIYWFEGGVNWRSFVSFVCGVAPGLPGLINAANPNITMSNGIIQFYWGSFIFQFLISVVLHYALNYFFPVTVGQNDEVDHYNTYTEAECKKYNIAPYTSTEEVDVGTDSSEQKSLGEKTSK